MDRVYWRPPQVSRNVLLVVAGLALAAGALVEHAQTETTTATYDDMLAAARRARLGLDAVDALRAERRLPLSAFDPAKSGLIGEPLTAVTSVTGSLPSKQTTINPDWAAVALWQLHQAGVKRGDVVACGFSGSFPALNLAVCAALETLGAEPIIVSSLTASQFGANRPRLLWTDMEAALAEAKIISFRSAAVTLGGRGDQALELSTDGRRLLEAGVARGGVPALKVDSLTQSVRARIALYRERAGVRPIAAYVNVGGGAASVGGPAAEGFYRPGLNRSVPRAAQSVESVMAHFAAQQVPILHFTHITKLAHQFRLPVQPTAIPAVGSGGVYHQSAYDRRLAAGTLALLLGALFLFVRSGRANALFSARPAKDAGSDNPQPMV